MVQNSESSRSLCLFTYFSYLSKDRQFFVNWHIFSPFHTKGNMLYLIFNFLLNSEPWKSPENTRGVASHCDLVELGLAWRFPGNPKTEVLQRCPRFITQTSVGPSWSWRLEENQSQTPSSRTLWFSGEPIGWDHRRVNAAGRGSVLRTGQSERLLLIRGQPRGHLSVLDRAISMSTDVEVGERVGGGEGSLGQTDWRKLWWGMC